MIVAGELPVHTSEPDAAIGTLIFPLKATPLPIQQRLNTLINEAITSPANNKRLTEEFALTAKPLTLEQCAAQDREERAKWADYVKIARIEPQ